jgi:hypothetical protein
MNLAPEPSAFSSLVVYSMYASVVATRLSLSGVLGKIRCKLFLASSGLFRRTQFQGDSGARYAAMKSGTGQIHCSAKGRRHAISPVSVETPLMTPEDSRIPAPQHMQTYAVTYGRSTVGTISQAYVVDNVCKRQLEVFLKLESGPYLKYTPRNTAHGFSKC